MDDVETLGFKGKLMGDVYLLECYVRWQRAEASRR